MKWRTYMIWVFLGLCASINIGIATSVEKDTFLFGFSVCGSALSFLAMGIYGIRKVTDFVEELD